MKIEALFLFLIILLGFLLCSFLNGNGNFIKEGLTGKFDTNLNMKDNKNISNSLGESNSYINNYDNYNHFTKTKTELTPGTTYYGKNGSSAVVIMNSDGTQSLQITFPNSTKQIVFSQKKNNSNNVENYENYGNITTYYGPNGETATIINTNDGQQGIKVQTQNDTYYYYTSGSNLTSSQYYGSTGYAINQYNGPYGTYGSVSGPNNTAYYAEGPNNNAVIATQNNNDYNAGYVYGPNGNTAYYAQGPNGNTIAGVNSNYDAYSSTLPLGIPKSQIPVGQEDLYILKSQVVPPVCPACSSSTICPRQEKCPPCPACARCPEPSFECKKVPNYNAINNEYLPSPVLNDFSQFGM